MRRIMAIVSMLPLVFLYTSNVSPQESCSHNVLVALEYFGWGQIDLTRPECAALQKANIHELCGSDWVFRYFQIDCLGGVTFYWMFIDDRTCTAILKDAHSTEPDIFVSQLASQKDIAKDLDEAGIWKLADEHDWATIRHEICAYKPGSSIVARYYTVAASRTKKDKTNYNRIERVAKCFKDFVEGLRTKRH